MPRTGGSFRTGRPQFDTADPRYSGLYGALHNQEWAQNMPDFTRRDTEWELQTRPTKDFLDVWLGKIQEVIDNYQPDLLWFDFGLKFVQEHYKREFLAYYYNKGREWGKDVAVTYKWHDLAVGSGVIDLELGRFDTLTYHDWITDTTVDDGQGGPTSKKPSTRSFRRWSTI